MLGTTKQRTIQQQAPQDLARRDTAVGRHGTFRTALLIVALIAAAAVMFAVISRTAPETAPAVDVTSGFEYNSEATSGKSAGDPVTGQYFGYNDELSPERDLTSGFEYSTEATTGRTLRGHVTGQYFGNSPELNLDN